MSSKPPFHHLNGRRQYSQKPNPEPPHWEVIKYINDSWKNVLREIEDSRNCAAEGTPSVSYYSSSLPEEQFPHPDFKRFDLDGFLERRSLQLQANKQQQSQ